MKSCTLKALMTVSLASLIAPRAVMGQFAFHEVNGKSVEVTDHGAPVFTFNYGVMLKEGTSPDRARCCYIYPVYAPNGWRLRHYGYVGVEYPALDLKKLDAATPLTMKFRLTLSGSDSTSRVAEKHILVYTHNGPGLNGKGYVHDNIQTSANAIRKMGAENGFSVDVTDDPLFFRDPVLKQYQALVFANTNNEAFMNDSRRDAFKHYIESGGGFVGIHSASGSERNWPYYWSVLGGKFVRHPHQQQFLVRVKDPDFSATRNLPATFEWTDECYYLDQINPDIHVLLVTDPAKLDDKDKAMYPGDRFGDSLPLSWYHQFDGGREYYIALGHNKADYSNPLLYNQILGGIIWAMGGK